MEKDIVLEQEDNIKKFTLNLKIDNYKEFVNYIFGILNKTDIDNVIFYTLLYKKYREFFPDIKNGNLEKIYNMYQILLHKLEYNELNIKERYIYEYINSFLILCGEFKNNKLFEFYCDKYLNNLNYNNFNKQIFLILQNIINDLNRHYNKNYKLRLYNKTKDKAFTNWLDKAKKDSIYLSLDIYLSYFYNKMETNVDIKKTLASEIFVILHEYKHLLQNDYMLSHNDDLSSRYKKDLYIITFREKSYDKYHDNLFIEKEANEFAFDNVEKYLSKYLEFSYFTKRDIEEFLMKRYHCPKNNKMFLLEYKYLKYYLELNKNTSKKIKFFNRIIDERKEEYKLKKI